MHSFNWSGTRIWWCFVEATHHPRRCILPAHHTIAAGDWHLHPSLTFRECTPYIRQQHNHLCCCRSRAVALANRVLSTTPVCHRRPCRRPSSPLPIRLLANNEPRFIRINTSPSTTPKTIDFVHHDENKNEACSILRRHGSDHIQQSLPRPSGRNHLLPRPYVVVILAGSCRPNTHQLRSVIRDTDKLRALLVSSMPDLAREYSLRLRVVQGDVLSYDDVANVLFPPQTL